MLYYYGPGVIGKAGNDGAMVHYKIPRKSNFHYPRVHGLHCSSLLFLSVCFPSWPKLSAHLLHHVVAPSPGTNVLLGKLPQFINSRRLSCYHTLNHFLRASYNILPRHRICNRLRFNPNNANPRIFRSTIVFSISQIPKPGFECRRIVFLDS